MKYKIVSSNPQVTISNPQVTSSNSRVTSLNPRITSANPQVTSSNSLVTSSDPRIIKSMKTQANNLNNSSSFPKIISPTKLLSNSWGSSVSGDNLLFYISTTPWLRLQQEAEWVNINFETRDLNSPQKSHPPPMILEKLAFVFVFNLRKQNVTDFSFILFTQNFVLCL